MLVWGGLSGVPTGGHFHSGLRTQAGPIVFNLVPFFDNATTPTAAYGYWRADNAAQPFTTRRSLQFRQDSMYANLHTALNPGGEIRGQVFRGARNLRAVLRARPAALLASSFSSFPSPFRQQVMLTFEARRAAPGTLLVTDVLGRTVAAQTILVQPGANLRELDLGRAAAGVYLVVVEADGSRLVTRVLKE